MDAATHSTLSVLIVEEDEYFALQLTAHIQTLGYLVVGRVQEHTETLSAISSLLPDIVFMGLDSPEKKLLFNYAKALKNRTPPILFITKFSKNKLYDSRIKGDKVNEENVRKAIKQVMNTLELSLIHI